jgi:cytochrome c5
MRLRIPVTLKVATLAVLTTLFYTYVGRLVPQKQVLPPAEIALSKDMTTEQMIVAGDQVMREKALCYTCHTVGQSGALRFPDLAGIGERAATRIPGMSDLEYLAQSLYHPDDYLVPGFNAGMPAMNKPPISLTDDEILTVVAKLQSMGGTATVTMETRLPYSAGGGPAPAPAPAPEGGDAPGAPTEASTEAAPGSTTPAVPVGGQALYQRFRCADCHWLDRDGAPADGTEGRTALGTGLERQGILTGILYVDESTPEGARKKAALTDAGLYRDATLQDLQALVDYVRSGETTP